MPIFHRQACLLRFSVCYARFRGRQYRGSSARRWGADQTQTGDDGRFTLSAKGSPDSILNLVASGGEPAANKGGSDNPAIALISVIGSNPPAKVVIKRVHNRGVRVDQRTVSRWHCDQG
jgi:hypothetical protein